MASHCAKVTLEVLVALCLCIQSCSGSFDGFALHIQVVARVLVALGLRIQIRQYIFGGSICLLV